MPIDGEDNQLVSCEECSNEFNLSEEGNSIASGYVCNDCSRYCSRCEEVGTDSDSWYEVDNESWCESCWEDDAFTCNNCSMSYNANTTDSSYVYNEGTWCHYCVDDSASYCDDCDEYYVTESGCQSDNCAPSNGVRNYTYKPNPKFHGNEPHDLFMGFELEMSFGDDSEDRDNMSMGAEMSSGLQKDNILYLKHDSSIEGYGFELVTHPHTLEAYEQQTKLWDYIELLRSKYDARSWDTTSCGLHVHVSRAAFKSGAHTHRFLTLIYKNPREMMKLAGRKNNRYAQFGDVYKPDEWGVPRFDLTQKIHTPYHTERYAAVNTINDATLELRFFKGTMAKSGIMSALELTHAATEYTRDLSVSDVRMGALTWEWFVSWVEARNGRYPNLYLKMSKVPTITLDRRELQDA